MPTLDSLLNVFRHPLNAIRGYRRILRLPFPAELNRRIARSFLLIRLGRYDRGAQIADIAGHSVKYLWIDSLIYMFEQLFIEREYHFPSNEVHPFIIDCGSNIGMSILFFKTLYPGAKVLGFEPDERAYACLERNISANRLGDVTVRNAALALRAGKIRFFSDPERPGDLRMSSIAERLPGPSREVDAVRLSDHVEAPVDFLKIDVEGSEMEVLKDLAQSGKLHFIRRMIIEYHHHIRPDENRLSELLALLEGAGFGYQISGAMPRPFAGPVFQDLLIYAYGKDARG
jgi:FkbM family methyltransferase